MRVLILTAALLIVPTAIAAGPQRHHADAPLRALQFVDANEGWSVSDVGLSGRPVWGRRQRGWLAADFSDIKTGALAGAWSSLAIMRENVFGKGETETFGGRNILGIRIYRDTAFAVGQGGLILKSE